MQKRILFVVGLLAVLGSNQARADEGIDLQWALCERSASAALAKLDREIKEEKEEQITYYDDESGSFTRSGVSLRTKQKGSELETSVKVRFAQPVELKNAECEWDRYARNERYTCEISSQAQSTSKIWSKAQLDLVAAHHPALRPDGLKAYGPYQDHKWKFKRKGVKLTLDAVRIPGTGELIELSAKVDYRDREDAYDSITRWLGKRGVALCEPQESKMERILRFARSR